MAGVAKPAACVVRFGVFEADLNGCELRKHGLRIKLQEQPFQILAMLLRRPGELVTRDELRRKIWPAGTFVDFDRSINKDLNKLRLALGDSAESPRFIETIPRHGYRFIAGVIAPENGEGSPVAAQDSSIREQNKSPKQTGAQAERGSEPSAIELPARYGLRRSYLIGIAALVLLGLGLVFYLRFARRGASTLAWTRRSVAVLSFKNLSGQPEQAWLSTALSDWLTTELAAGDQLRTIPEENVARMKIELALPEADSLARDSLARIRKNLGADFVVVGSYASLEKESEGQLRLDLRLQDARNGETIEAISETGTESHVFDIVSRAGTRLRAKLGIQAVTPEEAAELGRTLPSDPVAAQLYSRGLAKLRVFDALAARDLLQKAILAEPGFALSHSAQATVWARLGYDEKAKDEAKKAFDLSSNLPRQERLLVEAGYQKISGDWEKATQTYQTLFQFFPDNLEYGLALADVQVSGGKGKEALTTVEALRNLPIPLRDDPRIDLADAHAAESLGDFKRVQASAARAAEKAQAAGASLLLALARDTQAWAFANLGEQDWGAALALEAKRLFAAAGDSRGVAASVNENGIVLQNQGDFAGAKKMYEEALAVYRETGNRNGVASELNNIGTILIEMGDLSGAKKTLEESLATYREFGLQGGVALANLNLGEVLLALGDPAGAKKTLQQSVDICRQTGDRSKAAGSLADLGRVLEAEGALEEARKYEAQALAAFEEIGNKSSAAGAEVAVADVMIEQGEEVAAAAAASQSAQEFSREKMLTDESLAYAVVARALLAQGKLVDARRAVERANSLLGKGPNRDVALAVAITAARVDAASGGPANTNQAARSLRTALAEARSAGFVNRQLEARLALGEIQVRSGNSSEARASLKALKKDASDRGFGLIARKAAAALGTRTLGSEQPSGSP
jgi:DNA-binding winged helix-turn-helix (wHTH) protein/tetratricopeptide (TPR) repeat protein